MSSRWRRKTLLCFGAGAAILATLSCTAYLFAAMWLRARCVQELKHQSEPLPVIEIQALSAPGGQTEAGVRSFLGFVGDNLSPLVELEALQHPSPALVFRQLIRQHTSNARRLNQGQPRHWQIRPAPIRLWVSHSMQSATASSQNDSFVAVGADSASNTVGQFVLLRLRTVVGPRCYTVTDKDGETLLLILPRESTPGETQESVLVEMSGRILGRFEVPGGYLFGRLPDPLGKADQLVFGPHNNDAAENAGGQSSAWTVSVIERGKLKTVREAGSVSQLIRPAALALEETSAR